VLAYLVADGASGEFRELFRTEFGTQDLEFVRLAATPGGSRRSVAALWKHLTIKAQALPGAGGPLRDPSISDERR
jgi:hypothetical protein